MRGISDQHYLAIGLEEAAARLAEAAFPLRSPLEAELWQCSEHVTLAHAAQQEYRPVQLGHRFGPVWSTAWFRLRGDVPGKPELGPVALAFQTGTEALLFGGGRAIQGLGENHDLALLDGKVEEARLRPGQRFEAHVEAACNRPLGATFFFWDPPELEARWGEERPGRLDLCELRRVDRERFETLQDFEALRATLLAIESAEAEGILRDALAWSQSCRARAGLTALLDRARHGGATRCTTVGHAHIDTAWLWRMKETKRKVRRSFATAASLMHESEDFHFIASQAQHYAWLEDTDPQLFAEIRERVAEGRWSAAGAMWIEADCQIPSGESLVRQLMHGTRYFEERFGERGEQKLLFLPDSFGFPASLPQIARLAGIECFVTNKLSWCERNEFPHVSFRWRGIDGSEVLTHLTPSDNYNADLTPAELEHGQEKLQRLSKDPLRPGLVQSKTWLFLHGYGDGGGGPTREQVGRSKRLGALLGLPTIERRSIEAFCEELRDELEGEQQGKVPVWDGELYLELHRACFTSCAWLKEANARIERRLRLIEACLANSKDLDRARAGAAALSSAWRTLLLHQFHDILPGTSIAEVYEDARESLTAVEAELDALEANEAVLARAPRILNPCSTARDAVVKLGEDYAFVESAPPLSRVLAPTKGNLEVQDASPELLYELPEDRSVRCTDRSLENEHLLVRIDDAGRITELVQKGAIGQVGRGDAAPLNQLVLYDDVPRRWEAWDLDADYVSSAQPLEEPCTSIECAEAGPFRGVLSCSRSFGQSELRQRYVLDAGARALRVELTVDWQEQRKLLRALFPTRIRARAATYGIAYGEIQRPTHRNTSHETAQFEVPGHSYVDLSQPGLGFSVLDRAKYGKSAEASTLGLSLLRAPQFPAKDLDRGTHEIHYALLPHRGDRSMARVWEEAEAFLDPVRVESNGAAVRLPFELLSRGQIEIAAFKLSEDGSARILRLVERDGSLQELSISWKSAPSAVHAVDLHERKFLKEIPIAQGESEFLLKPFQILTLRIEGA